MFRFEHPEFIWFVIVTVAITAGFFIRKKMQAKELDRWGTPSTIKRLSERFQQRNTYIWVLLAGFLMLNLALLNPQWGTRTREVEKKTADIYLLFDISNSMLAEDVAPNRLERAKLFAREVAAAFRKDRIGLVFFAGNAYMQSPLTTDWKAIELFLNSAHPDQAGTQGTAIGEAVLLATMDRQSEEGSEDVGNGALVIITDGEDHDSDAAAAVRGATSSGWTTYVVGVGSDEGGNIPMLINGRRDAKRDETGQPVITKMNRKLMTELAQEGQGKYYDITAGEAIISDLKGELARLERSHEDKRSFSEQRSYYQWFLIAAIAIILTVVTVRYKYDVV